MNLWRRPLAQSRPDYAADDRSHDRGRGPLYVRAQLETVGLGWTQRDIAGLKATAREAGKLQLTGYFRWWWQVLGSNQRRLSRRFYRPLLYTSPHRRIQAPFRRPGRSAATQVHLAEHVLIITPNRLICA